MIPPTRVVALRTPRALECLECCNANKLSEPIEEAVEIFLHIIEKSVPGDGEREFFILAIERLGRERAKIIVLAPEHRPLEKSRLDRRKARKCPHEKRNGWSGVPHLKHIAPAPLKKVS